MSEPTWWICPKCGFDAKQFEPRPEAQPGTIKWHAAVCDRCRFGRIEYDGDQYCHAHGGFRSHYAGGSCDKRTDPNPSEAPA